MEEKCRLHTLNFLSMCCFTEDLLCHLGSPGNKKTAKVGEAGITAVEETTDAVLMMARFAVFDLWVEILH